MNLFIHNFLKHSSIYNIRKLLKKGTKVTGSHDILGMMEIPVVCNVMPYSLIGRCRYARLDDVTPRRT
jgi:hypothetical protein